MVSNLHKSQTFKRVGECLYRNGNKAYFAIIKVAGKQIKRSLKTVDLPLAKRRLAEFRTRTDRLQGSAQRNIRFDEMADVWLKSIEPHLKPKSWDRRRVALVGLRPYFKGIAMKACGYREIDDWQQKRGVKLSARSYNIELETLKILFRYACERGILLENYALKYKRRKQHRKLPSIPTRGEFFKLLAGLRNAPKAVASGSADMVEFLAYSGTRVGEAREVRMSDIDFDNRRITITGGELGTKNNEQRAIPLFPDLKELFERMFKSRANLKQSSKLFPIQSPRGAMQNACERMRLSDFTVHSLRHFFASNAIEQDANFKVVAEWLGHKDGGVLVAKTYGHLRPDFSAQVAERMSIHPATAKESENHMSPT
jgi:integrase